MAPVTSRLFKPLKIGDVTLQHRIVMAPLTRFRAEDGMLMPMAVEYYEQRAVIPGTLLISEATMVSARASAGYPDMPGIWTDEHIGRWREVTDAVHAKGSYMYCQLFAPGRVAALETLTPRGFPLDAPSPVPIASGTPEPHALTEEEIAQYIGDFAQAAKNALAAGFDGVEVHGANGYLVDQFIQDVSNIRTDRWGGSVEKRNRFAVEITRAIVAAVGPERVGFRISPWSTFQEMRMQDPVPQFSALVRELRGLKLGYLHIVEARVTNNIDNDSTESVDFLLDIWDRWSPVLLAGGFRPENAADFVDNVYRRYDNVALAFGRYFISTPDLPFRVERGMAPNPYDRQTFYTPRIKDGYVDYPYSDAFLEELHTIRQEAR